MQGLRPDAVRDPRADHVGRHRSDLEVFAFVECERAGGRQPGSEKQMDPVGLAGRIGPEGAGGVPLCRVVPGFLEKLAPRGVEWRLTLVDDAARQFDRRHLGGVAVLAHDGDSAFRVEREDVHPIAFLDHVERV